MKAYLSASLRSFSFPLAALTFGLTGSTLAACSPTDSVAQTGGSHSGGSQAATGGAVNNNTGGVAPTTGGTPATGGTVSTGGTAPSTGGTSAGTGGSGGSAAGGQSTGGTAGSASGGGGSSGGGASGAAGNAGAGGASAGAGGAAGGGKGVACPANATFCSGFESAALPTGAVYKLNGDPATPWTHDFEVDTTVHNSGASSLRVRTNTEASGAYKMLAVPTGGATFFVRFYIRSDVDLGASDHNVYGQASGSDDPNDSISVELAEDVGLAFNSHDMVIWPTGFGRVTGGGTMPFTLPKDTWHCIELSFDGQARVQTLSINGVQKINATNYPMATAAFKTFKFGYNALHGTVRKTWYDDVAVAPTSIGCL
jgi:hypothetical protein